MCFTLENKVFGQYVHRRPTGCRPPLLGRTAVEDQERGTWQLADGMDSWPVEECCPRTHDIAKGQNPEGRMTASKRYMALWFRHLTTDCLVRKKPELKAVPFVLAAPERGRMVIKAANIPSESKGIDVNMVVADCRAIYPELLVFDHQPEQPEKLLHALAEWCMRYTPITSVDIPDGLILDISGCAHLWGGERPYLKEIVLKLRGYGYDVRAAIADTIVSS